MTRDITKIFGPDEASEWENRTVTMEKARIE